MNSKIKVWFNLFASCQIVKGYEHSLIYDIERMAFYDLSNDFLDILNMAKTKDISTIKQIYNNQQDNLIDDFFNQFIESEIGFYTEDPNSFPAIDFTWESPYYITNSIIELDEFSEFNLEDLIYQLDNLGCCAIQIRILFSISTEKLKIILNNFNNLRIQHLDIFIPYSNTFDYTELYTLIELQPRLNRILVYASLENKIFLHENHIFDKTIIHLKKDIRFDSTEIINVDRFSTNIEIFSEAQQYNIGLNRKVSINKQGDIMNYLDHNKIYGNIKIDSIEKIISQKEFQEKWFISNDKIETCKECQYRYTCISNSDIIIDNNKYYKANMCNFDPIKNLWNTNET